MALGHPLGPWHHGCVNQGLEQTVIDPTTGLLYVWENGRVSLFEMHSRSQYR
jgi:hypothetical protein